MKNWWFLFSFLLIPFLMLAQSYEIKGVIKGFENQDCYIGYYYGNQTLLCNDFIQDTVTLSKEGEFVFRSTEPLNHGLYLIIIVDKESPNDSFFIDIIISQDKTSFYVDKNDKWNTIKFTSSDLGGVENQAFYDFRKFFQEMDKIAIPLREKLSSPSLTKIEKQSLSKQIQEMGERIQEKNQMIVNKYPNSFLSKMLLCEQNVTPPKSEDVNENFNIQFLQQHYLDNIDFNDKRILRAPIFHQRIDYYINKLTYPSPDSVIQSIDFIINRVQEYDVFKYLVNYFATTYEKSKIMGMDKVFVHMVYKYILSEKVDWIEETQLVKIKQAANNLFYVLLDNTAPDIQMKDNKGNYKSLHGINSEYTILCFYDPDCGHCKTEVPMLKGLQERLKEKNVDLTIFAVNIEHEPEKWHKFIKEEELESWIHLENFDNTSNFRQYYYIAKTPEMFLLDKNKKILAKKLGVEQLEDYLNNRLGNNGSPKF